MKGLSIEEKAKAYDERLAKARKEYSIHEANNAIGIMNALERVFTELKENEDEKIRKDIIWCLKHSGIKEGNPINPHVTTIIKDAIAWLEKQGEQKPQRMVSAEAKEAMYNKPAWSEEDDKMVNHISKDLDELEEKSSWKYIDEQVNWLKSLKDRVLLQPKQEWTNDDTAYLAGVMETELYMLDVVNGIKPFAVGNKSIKEECEKELEWLKSLESRVLPQPKQEWSEEDERVLSLLLNNFKQAVEHRPSSLTHAEVLDIYNWLKSLKERYTWKPSEEQIDALEDAIADAVSSIQKNMLNSLYQDIKKLKGG